MRHNKKTILIVGLIAMVSIAILGVCFPYPRSWSEIHPGDTQDQVWEKTQGTQHQLFSLIQDDFFLAGGGPVNWELEVRYGPNNRVTNTYLFVSVRVRNYWTRFPV